MTRRENSGLIPDRLYIVIPGLTELQARTHSTEAVQEVIRLAPKLTMASSRRFEPISGAGYFGIRWQDDFVWFQEMGMRAFTMRSLAGKTIPMWIDDPRGVERQKNPHARVRITASGRTQVLIFRKAARLGQRKTVMRGGTMREVPAAYPGAPGRIGLRESARPFTAPGRVGGRIARNNVGVRWRHPGIRQRGFIHEGLISTAERYVLPVIGVFSSLGQVVLP